MISNLKSLWTRIQLLAGRPRASQLKTYETKFPTEELVNVPPQLIVAAPPIVFLATTDVLVPALGPTIAITNLTTVLTDAEIATAIAALQIQINRDFAPAWNVSATLVAVAKGKAPPIGAWVMNLMDISDQAGALGYHDLTADGLPLGKVFVKDDLKFGLSWTVTLSHEILESLGDPYIQNAVFIQKTNTTGTLYALEVCDPCEDDSIGYLINGVQVSDFVYPTWFEVFRRANSTKFDHMGILTAPLQLAKGGYIGTFVVAPNSTSGWTQRLAETGPIGARAARKGIYSRTIRRTKREQHFTN